MKKVLIITQTTDLYSGWGRYSHKIIEGLKRSHDVGFLEEGEVRHDLLKKDSFSSFTKNIFLSRKSARDKDIVHVLDGWPYAVYGYFAVLGTDKKLFINAVGTYSMCPQNLFSLKGILMKLAYRRATKIFSISNYTERELKKSIPWVDAVVVPLGVSPLPPPTPELLNSIEKKIIGKFPVILTAGALKKRKGQVHTLKAILKLKDKYPNILYVIVGDDSDEYYKKEIMSFARENNLAQNILITGTVTDEELSGWYGKSNLLALNSINHNGHFEGFGLVLLEAAQFGKPAVGSRNCGIEDAIVDGETGYLANQGDEEEIASKIDATIRQEESMGEKAKERAKRFTWQKTADAYMRFYE